MANTETCSVTQVSAADSVQAEEWFSRRFGFETDCADVHSGLAAAATAGVSPAFVLLDVRSPEAFARGHVDGARNLPHRTIDQAALANFPQDTVFVVYCAGPHCNAAQRGALRLARLGRPVKEMMGGVTGWLDEGFSLVAEGQSSKAS